jgi:shikimate dehydrogenase
MRPLINKETVMCMSLAARPGNFGTRFHNYLYEALDLDYLYKAFSTQDIVGAIAGVRALNIRGCAISMPFKEASIPLVDELDPSAQAIDSINTIVNTNGHLKAYNTDYMAIAQLLADYQVSPDLSFALRGSGGLAKAVACALRDAGFRNGTIVARNEHTGRQLAELYGFHWAADIRDVHAQLLLNATPIGMPGGPEAEELAYTPEQIAAADVIFEVVASSGGTPLIRAAREQHKRLITGEEVFALQAVEQFVLYTGIRPDAELFARAAAHARGQGAS